MKKIIFIVVSLVACGIASAQSIEELDKKAGFKEFKIGDTLSLHESKIRFTRTLDNADTKLYLVKDLQSVKSYTGEVELEMYKGKIQEVVVSFKNSTKTGFEDILKSLETLYGEYSKDKEKDKAFDRFEKLYSWTGKRIKLVIGYDENYKLTKLFYIENTSLEKLKEEF